ncbi:MULTISPECIES: NUDIX domain-containing protein [unclassified Bradyrhizobium]|uniref:NUDIX domain-containing protein n=1 Tax=unclassified Bradyrhizobium TaxID=2631580 RepID=UPI002916B11D|nr:MULTISPECIES: NUDIX domain-containing protein [unclassified Bradyrhizobium]
MSAMLPLATEYCAAIQFRNGRNLGMRKPLLTSEQSIHFYTAIGRALMASFADSYVGQLRRVVGCRLLLVPGARIVIENSKAEVLLQKRSDFDVWGLPGGNAEEGENLDVTIAREVTEETGLELVEYKPFGFGCDPLIETFTFPNGDRCQYFVLSYFSRSFRGVPRVGDDESTAVRWFSVEALPPMLPNMLKSVKAYLEFSRSGEFQMI